MVHLRTAGVADAQHIARHRARMFHEMGQLPVDAVSRCIELPTERLCRACVTGDYPTPTGEKLYQLALRNHAIGGGDGRTYDRPHEPLVCSVNDAGQT